MKYSPSEVMQYIKEDDVKFIRLAFCDIFGIQKNIAIMPSELDRAFLHGIPIDASLISGFGTSEGSDVLLHPDASTLMQLPWRPESGKVVRMFCDISQLDGTPSDTDGRHILKDAIKKATDAGIDFAFGSESEFYLFQNDDNGKPTILPHDMAGYLDIAPLDKGENVRREICLTLEKMGIVPKSSHHEIGPGQNEIDFLHDKPLSAADNEITFRTIVQTVASRYGLTASFMPKPLDDKPGSGLHVNIYAHDSHNDSHILYEAIAGIMNHASEMTAFFNPCDESYKRLNTHSSMPYISWSYQNRSQLVRIVSDGNSSDTYAAFRSPDPMANPYIMFALMIHAGLDGIFNHMSLDEEALVSPGNIDNDTRSKKYKRLPNSLAKANKEAMGSTFINSVLPAAVIDSYCKRG